MEYIRLYTRQHENSLYELERKGRITNKRLYVELHLMDTSKFFLEKYDYFVKEAEKRIPRESESEYPIWCSVSKYNCLKPINKQVVYALRVPVEEVIIFDGTRWDLVLNNQYIAKDEKDQKDFQRLLEANGLSHTFCIFDRKYIGAFDDIKEKIVESWSRIFEITDRSIFTVQANLWKIEENWIEMIIRPGEDFFEKLEGIEDTWEE